MKILERLSLLTLLPMIMIISSCNYFTPSEPVVLSEEEHQIILAFMNKTGAYGDTLLLVNKTMSNQTAAHLRERLLVKGIAYDNTILNDYDELQKDPRIFDGSLLPDTVTLLDPTFLEVLQDTCVRWDNELKELYPGTDGYISFSRPAISDDGQSAILECHHTCGYWCGAWGASLMSKESGEWKFKDYIVVAMAKKNQL